MAATIIGGCAALGGCTGDAVKGTLLDPNYINIPARTSAKDNLVQWRSVKHSVAFAPGSSSLKPIERKRLRSFLARIAARRGEGVSVLLSEASTPKGARLVKRRGATVRAYLHRRGLRVRRVTAVPGSKDPNAALVIADRAFVAVANCPEWRQVMKQQRVTVDNWTFGCVTAASLGTSVARPRDLIKGRKLGTADGPAMTKGINDYRSGKIDSDFGKALNRSSTSAK